MCPPRIACVLGIAVPILVSISPVFAADTPVIEAVIDSGSDETLWDAGGADASLPVLYPGQRIILKGRNFGPGPLTWALPGLTAPSGGEQLDRFPETLEASPPARADAELSKVVVGHVRALERNISSYPARIDVGTFADSLLAELQGEIINYFVEVYEEAPDTWAGDIYAWSDTEIELSVPATAYEGPIRVTRIPTSGGYVVDIRSGAPLRYRDPNTERVMADGGRPAFTEGWRIARTLDQPVLTSNAVPVAVAGGGEARRRYAAPATASETDARAARAALRQTDTAALGKDTPTGRSAADQYAYGEKAYWSWDWNLGQPHFLLGVDWDGIFGFPSDEYSLFLDVVRSLRNDVTGIPRPEIDAEGYVFPVLAADGSVRKSREHKPIVDRTTGVGVNPFESFGAVPLLPERGSARLIAPGLVYDSQAFKEPTPYPIPMAVDLPFSEPLVEGVTNPTGWVGYVYADASNPVPGGTDKGKWIGFSCATCHADRVTFEYDAAGHTVTKLFNGIPNPNWKATFLTLSGRGHGLRMDEALPETFIQNDYPPGTGDKVADDLGVTLLRPFDFLGIGYVSRKLASAETEASQAPVDKTLMIYSLPPGTTESSFFNSSTSKGAYANDYFFSPQAIPIITNHTPARRALSHSELIDGFEGAYLHGEEPEGARGPMSSRALQDLTLFASAMRQEDELLRRIGLYRWLRYKGLGDLLVDADGEAVSEGAFVSAGYPEDLVLQPPGFPPKAEPESGLHSVRDAAIAGGSGGTALNEAFAREFPDLAGRIVAGAGVFRDACARCHAPGNHGLWTNEDMNPISASGGPEPVGRYFTPAVWHRRTQAIRTAILQNLFWVQRRGLLSDGHIHTDAPDNMDGLDLLVRPDRCRAPVREDGAVDLERASETYRRLYTIRQGADHSFRIPAAGRRFELMTRFGGAPGVIQQRPAANTDRLVTPEEAEFVRRHAYFTPRDDGYLYWDYQKMRRTYGILEFGLDPDDPEDRDRIGGLPAMPHPWCLEEGADQETIDDLVIFLLTL